MRLKGKKGLTLIEVLICLAIVGIFVALAMANCNHLFSGKEDWNDDEITCSWWVKENLCLCQVGMFDTRWGFVAPHRVCDRNDDHGTR